LTPYNRATVDKTGINSHIFASDHTRRPRENALSRRLKIQWSRKSLWLLGFRVSAA
jgi:hypothetical protein